MFSEQQSISDSSRNTCTSSHTEEYSVARGNLTPRLTLLEASKEEQRSKPEDGCASQSCLFFISTRSSCAIGKSRCTPLNYFNFQSVRLCLLNLHVVMWSVSCLSSGLRVSLRRPCGQDPARRSPFLLGIESQV